LAKRQRDEVSVGVNAVERRIEMFVAKYTPEIAAATRLSRAKMHAIFPRGHELVYDNYNALVFGYSPTERASDAIVSIAAYPRWVTLFFLHGASLADPGSLLTGNGKRVRSVALKAPADLDSAPVKALLERAIATRRHDFDAAPALTTVVKSVSARQRPRRPSAPGRAGRASK